MAKRFITGIVLAGGRSSRMGTNKALLKINEKPLIQYAVDALKPICSEVVISSNTDDYHFTGCEVWPDEIPAQAPIIGILSCLKRSGNETNIVLSCDMPNVTTDLLEYLLSHSANYDITVPEHSNHTIEPLCGVYKKDIVPPLESFVNNKCYTLSEFIFSSLHKFVNVENVLNLSSDIFLNVNTLEEFNLFKRIHPEH